MNVLLHPEMYNINYVYFNDSIKNTVIENSNFIKIMFSNEDLYLNGIYLSIPLQNIILEKYYNKHKCIIDTEINKNILNFLFKLESNILDKYDNQKIKNHGSQGEHKIFLALLKITEYIFLSNKTKKTPIFLIDDMFANLDKERSKKLLRFIEKIKNDNKEKSQTIITTTNIINIKENGFFMEFDDIKKHHLVKNGTAQKSS